MVIAFARVSRVRVGSKVTCDDGFTCLEVGRVYEVQGGEDEMLYIPCEHGQHYLSGQLSDDGSHYVGIYLT